MNSLVSVAGSVLIIVVCTYVVLSLSTQLWSRIQSNTAIDRNLSEVDRDDVPRMFWLQIAGSALMIGAAVWIGLSLVANLVAQLFSQW